MSKYIIIIAACVLCLMGGAVFADEIVAADLYIDEFLTADTQYNLVPSAFSNAGDSGLTTNKAYVCFRVDAMSSLSEAEAAETGAGSDIRELIFALVELFYAEIQANDATNRPAYLTIQRSVQSDASADLLLIHRIDSKVAVDTQSVYDD